MRNIIIPVVLIVGMTLSILPLANAQSTYSWTLNCKRSGGLVGNIFAQWNWTSNGKTVQSNTAFCSATPGSGTVPSSANGITARLVTEFSRGTGCFNQDSVTKSFASGTVPSIQLKSSCSTSAYGQRDTASAFFTMGPTA